MRLLYQHIVRTVSKENCRLIIRDLRRRVATGFDIGGKPTLRKKSKLDTLFNFLTTSRPVETWLQNVEATIHKMRRSKVSNDLWMVTGGYGSGKSHMKEFLKRNEIENIKFLEPKVRSMLRSDENTASTYDVFSLILLETKPFLNTLYDTINKRHSFPSNSVDDEFKKMFRGYSIDDDFINAFCTYAGSSNGNRSDFQTIEELIIKKGELLFLPLMKLYKKYLDINGLCIFMDEFESLQLIDLKQQMRFVESIRAFYDTIVSTGSDPDLPSFLMVILCTLSFWNELTSGTRSQALETRVTLFEIPPLVEDELLTLAEKIYVIHKKSGYPAPEEFPLEFNRLPAYLVQRAGIDAPLTPRFVIGEIIEVIEKPNKYFRFNSHA